MGTVSVDLAAARAAVEVTAQRAADLMRSLPDPSIRVPGLDWTVGQTAAHLVAAARVYPRYATGQLTPEATIDLAEGNLHRIAQVGDHGLAELADLLLVRGGVACLPGTAFGAHGEGYLRFSYANSVERIREALEAIELVVGELPPA